MKFLMIKANSLALAAIMGLLHSALRCITLINIYFSVVNYSSGEIVVHYSWLCGDLQFSSFNVVKYIS